MDIDDTKTYTISLPSNEDGSIDGLTVGGTIDCTTSAGSYSYDTSYYTGASTVTIPTSITFDNYNEYDSGITINEGDLKINDDGDIKIGNRSLKTFMDTMEKRLAILQPDPEKLEKFEALRKAYEHYKTMESLCHDDANDDEAVN